jgi:hypothetical protein
MGVQMRRWAVLLAFVPLGAVVAAAPPARDSQKKKTAETGYFKGKVVPLADVVAKSGSKLDADAAPFWLALAGDDGKVYPLVKDAGSRLFFADKALQGRPMRLRGKLIPGSQLLRVMAVNSLIKGVPHEVYYYCDICSIRRGEKMICECCGGKMELREVPLKK